jgi:hypothetical protein
LVIFLFYDAVSGDIYTFLIFADLDFHMYVSTLGGEIDYTDRTRPWLDDGGKASKRETSRRVCGTNKPLVMWDLSQSLIQLERVAIPEPTPCIQNAPVPARVISGSSAGSSHEGIVRSSSESRPSVGDMNQSSPGKMTLRSQDAASLNTSSEYIPLFDDSGIVPDSLLDDSLPGGSLELPQDSEDEDQVH